MVGAPSLQSRLTLGRPLDCSPPGSSVHGDSPGKSTEADLPCPPAGDLPDLGIEPRSHVSCVDRRVLYHFCHPGSPLQMELSIILENIFAKLVAPWTAAHQAHLSMGFLRQEYWSGLPFPMPGDFCDPETESASPELTGGFSTTNATWAASQATHCKAL